MIRVERTPHAHKMSVKSILHEKGTTRAIRQLQFRNQMYTLFKEDDIFWSVFVLRHYRFMPEKRLFMFDKRVK